jgi:hypothetical protein
VSLGVEVEEGTLEGELEATPENGDTSDTLEGKEGDTDAVADADAALVVVLIVDGRARD